MFRENELDRYNKPTTLIFRDLKDSWKVEVGAMRLPHHHRFTHHLIQKFGLKTSLFYNKHADDYFYFRGLKVKECWMHVYPAFGMSCVTFFEITFQFLQSAVDADVMKFFQKEFGLTDEEAKTDPVRLYSKVCIC